MAKLQASWVHGSSVQIEREGYFISKRRYGWGTEFKTHGKEWFHFVIPTPVYVENQRSFLKKIFVLFETQGAAEINAVHVYDGKEKFASFNNIRLKGKHSEKLDQINTWVFYEDENKDKKHYMKFGLGISVLVNFGERTPGDVPGILFATAGADFVTP